MSPLLNAVLDLGPQLAEHVLLCAAAVALGIVVALPLAVWASRSPAVAKFALGFASLVQTIPALALLALFFPILLAARTVFGEDLPTLGFLPAWLALALYALLPILRNAVTALANLDDELIEAADGLGMTCLAGAHGIVVGRLRISPGIAGGHPLNAIQGKKHSFHTPETTTSQHSLLQTLTFRLKVMGRGRETVPGNGHPGNTAGHTHRLFPPFSGIVDNRSE